MLIHKRLPVAISLFRWLTLPLERRLDSIEDRALLLLAALWGRGHKHVEDAQMTLKRILISGDEVLHVEGTQAEIAKAAVRMSRRTRHCVVVAVVVAHYHRRNCDEMPRGGFVEEGN